MTHNIFYRTNARGDAVLLHDDGTPLTRQPDEWPTIWPLDSDLSGRYEHPGGIVVPLNVAQGLGLDTDGGTTQ